MVKKEITKIKIITILIIAILGFILFGYLNNPILTGKVISNDPGTFSYHINITNSNIGQDANITQINITIPILFTFIKNSNETDATANFENISNILSWKNSTEYVINGSDSKNFWFDLTCQTPGEYNFTITTLNGTGLFSFNMTIEISDNLDYSINFVDPTPEEEDLEQFYIPINITIDENIEIANITIFLYNSTDLLNSPRSSTSPFFINFTNLKEEIYYINSTVEDTYGNIGSTETRSFELFNYSCNPNWNCTNWSECLNGIQTRNCTDLNSCGDTPYENKSCACVPDWNCTGWSDCVNELKNRTCIDNNNCNNNSTKPLEEDNCTIFISCAPDWNCTEWTPEECPKEEKQTRTCMDDNDCNKNGTKPNETKNCTYQGGGGFLIMIIILILLAIAATIIFLIFKFKKQDGIPPTNSGTGTPPGNPPRGPGAGTILPRTQGIRPNIPRQPRVQPPKMPLRTGIRPIPKRQPRVQPPPQRQF